MIPRSSGVSSTGQKSTSNSLTTGKFSSKLVWIESNIEASSRSVELGPRGHLI